ncbi:MAG: cation-transporting P-type ATPase [Patescibacteria group bacterium]|nr:cation-transporting P-type ATPase [Patescibacteria group bacterium]
MRKTHDSPPAQSDWHSLTGAQALHRLRSNETGLSTPEAERRSKHYGLNAIPRKSVNADWVILLAQFRGPVVAILLFAMALTAALRQWVDFCIIAAVIAINALVGFIQERKANRAFEMLREMVTFRAHVLRDGRELEIPAEAVVPGDLMVITAGNRVPADGRLLSVHQCTVVESSLTGEAAPVTKNTDPLAKGAALADRTNLVYQGTTVASGHATAVAYATGSRTELGQIAALVQDTAEVVTPLQLKLRRLSRQLSELVLVLAAIVLVIGLLHGRPLLSAGAWENSTLYLAVAIAVSAIPEGMLVIVTVILALGMRAILRKGALVRQLSATETLGSTSIICTDKTGTMTEGQMRISHLITPERHILFHDLMHDPQLVERMLLLKIGVLCSNASVENPDDELRHWRMIGDPTETALYKSAAEVGLSAVQLRHFEPRLDEIPFSPEAKYMATLHRADAKRIIYCKGAPERLLELSDEVEIEGKIRPLDAPERRNLHATFEKFSRQGLRLLGMAYRRIGETGSLAENLNHLIFVGFVALKDPLRPETSGAIAQTRKAGIRTIIITGDHRLTAQAIAEEIGIPVKSSGILEGAQLDQLTDGELERIVNKIDVYARVTPKHKLRIVNAWQRRGEVVAMTGDGVNDAPALKAADIGIALNSGTDIAKETADLVLLENNFNTIVTVVKQGRIIFDNIRKAVLYLLSDSFTEVSLVCGALLFNLPLPLLPAQILWINLIDDCLPAIALTAERGEETEVMLEPPRRRSESVIDFRLGLLILIICGTISALLFNVFLWLVRASTNIDYLRTIIFTELAVDSLLYVFSTRSLRHTLFTRAFTGNPYLLGAVGIGFSLQILAVYEPHLQRVFRTVPLGAWDWLLIAGLAGTIIAVIEASKYLVYIRPSKKPISAP